MEEPRRLCHGKAGRRCTMKRLQRVGGIKSWSASRTNTRSQPGPGRTGQSQKKEDLQLNIASPTAARQKGAARRHGSRASGHESNGRWQPFPIHLPRLFGSSESRPSLLGPRPANLRPPIASLLTLSSLAPPSLAPSHRCRPHITRLASGPTLILARL